MAERYYRHEIRVSILTKGPVSHDELANLSNVDYETDEGLWVGYVDVTGENIEISREDMEQRLEEAGSSPDFFDEEED